MHDIFEPQKEVPALELCIRLKELGYPQLGDGWYYHTRVKEIVLVSGKYYWFLDEQDGKYFDENYKKWLIETFMVKMPTVRELGEWLPDVVVVDNFEYHIYYSKQHWRYWYVNKYGEWLNTKFIEGNTEADARAKMLIWLAENGYVKFDETL